MCKWNIESSLVRLMPARLHDTDSYPLAHQKLVIHTELFRQFPKFIQWISWPIQRLFFLRPEQGALTQLYLAASKDVEEQDIQGQYYVCRECARACIPVGPSRSVSFSLYTTHPL